MNPLEKIIVGDDQIDFAKQNFPNIPNVEIEFVADPYELIQKVKGGNYNTIVTDLNYTENGEEGYIVLETLKDIEAKKILWTGNAYDSGVQEKGQALGAEVLDKNEIGAIVGQVVSKAPLKKKGKVLVYATAEAPVVKALEKVGGVIFDDVVVTTDIKELLTNQYGLVIDTSTMTDGRKHGVVAHDMKYLKLDAVPRVQTVYNTATVVADIKNIAENYLKVGKNGNQ